MLLFAHLHIAINQSSLVEDAFTSSLLLAQESLNNFSQLHEFKSQKLAHVNQFLLVVAMFLLEDRDHRQFLLQELEIAKDIGLILLLKVVLLQNAPEKRIRLQCVLDFGHCFADWD